MKLMCQKIPFIQRIDDSNTIIVLFPTGLLMMINIAQQTINATIKLNLRNDESIIDYSYCISQDGNSHCIWLLDQKMQVWKVTNYRSSTKTNWNLVKSSSEENLVCKAFFQPAMTYDTFYMLTSFYGIKCFNKIKPDDQQRHEYLFTQNGSSTKAIMVEQATIFNENVPLSICKHNHKQDGLLKFIENAYGQPRHLIKSNEINIKVVSKKQQIIVNQLKLKSRKERQKNIQTNDIRMMYERKQRQIDQKENEIISMDYMGKNILDKNMKKASDLDENSQVYRQFLIRRRKSLEIMLTNGIHMWIEEVPGSQIEFPHIIQNMELSQNNMMLSISYGAENNDDPSKTNFKSFTYDKQTSNFRKKNHTNQVSFETNDLQDANASQKFVFFNSNNKEIEIRIELLDNPYKDHMDYKSLYESIKMINMPVYYGQILHIKIPWGLVNMQLLDGKNHFDRLMISCDCKILFSGRLVIQLDARQEKIQNLGCIVYHKQQSKYIFQFLSLLEEKSSKLVLKYLNDRESMMKVMKFTNDYPPIHKGNQLYFMCHLNEGMQLQHTETAIVRMNPEHLTCDEIYRSKQKVIHLAMIHEKDMVASESLKRKKTISKKRETEVTSSCEDEESGNQDTCQDIIPPRLSKNAVGHQIPLNIFPKKKSELSQADIMEIAKDQDKFILISAVSQSNNQIKLQIIKDKIQEQIEIENQKTQFEVLFSKDKSNKQAQNKLDQVQDRAKLLYYLTFVLQDNLLVDSEVSWVTQQKLVLTIDNDYYLVNLAHKQLQKTSNGILYGTQILNMGLYASIVTCEDQNSIEINDTMLKSQKSILRMDIASLNRYAFIQRAKRVKGLQNTLLFFLPCEELLGASMFSTLAYDLNTIQPYLEKVDINFIIQMKKQIVNSTRYLRSKKLKRSNRYVDGKLDEKIEIIHMYHEDIMGETAIDKAYMRNSIFCIRAFVDNLLQLQEVQNQFRNCFDKALLLMIDKNLDTKELVSSELFYPSLWTQHSIFSEDKESQIIAYNNDLEDLEMENPYKIFNISENIAVDEHIKRDKDPKKWSSDIKQQYEMEFNYICLQEIEGSNKISLIKSLNETKDLQLFQKEAIQRIIDYKWNTYAYRFFQQKLFVYLIFTIFFYWDMMHIPVKRPPSHELDMDIIIEYHNALDESFYSRNKDYSYYIRKIVILLIQSGFLTYEIKSFIYEGYEYVQEIQNFFDVAGILITMGANIMEMINEDMTDFNRIIYVFSIISQLFKVLFLVRVSSQLSFLVIIIFKIVSDVRYFMIIFFFFVSAFALCFHLVSVDHTTYGRIPELLALFFSTLRCAMGDFSILNMRYGFDLMDLIDAEAEEGEQDYKFRFNQGMVLFTYFIYIIVIFFIFMIFMNFLIAVIGQSYQEVIVFSEAHDYQQRANMIYEREIHFKQNDFENEIYFPKVLVVRQKKRDSRAEQFDLASITKLIKTGMKDQKDHFQISFSKLDGDVITINKDVKQVMQELQEIQSEVKHLHHIKNAEQSKDHTNDLLLKHLTPQPNVNIGLDVQSLGGQIESQSNIHLEFQNNIQTEMNDLKSMMKLMMRKMDENNKITTQVKEQQQQQIVMNTKMQQHAVLLPEIQVQRSVNFTPSPKVLSRKSSPDIKSEQRSVASLKGKPVLSKYISKDNKRNQKTLDNLYDFKGRKPYQRGKSVSVKRRPTSGLMRPSSLNRDMFLVKGELGWRP